MRRLVLFGIMVLVGDPARGVAQERQQDRPPIDRARDRGEGLPTSMFGTYVSKGEFLVYPFFEYYRDRNVEYRPDEFGAVGETDYRGQYRAKEALIFVSYGITERLAVEFETAAVKASFDRAAEDRSGLPARRTESGLGDVEGQVRWRWSRETERHPEVFSYAEAVVPHHRDKRLIGTPGWELKAGAGVIRGFGFGTLTARAALNYDQSSSSHFDLGEYAVEYLRRVSKSIRVYGGLEGTQDELSLIGELQWHVSPHAFIRFNNGVGVTSKATDWSPEVGVVFSLGR